MVEGWLKTSFLGEAIARSSNNTHHQLRHCFADGCTSGGNKLRAGSMQPSFHIYEHKRAGRIHLASHPAPGPAPSQQKRTSAHPMCTRVTEREACPFETTGTLPPVTPCWKILDERVRPKQEEDKQPDFHNFQRCSSRTRNTRMYSTAVRYIIHVMGAV